MRHRRCLKILFLSFLISSLFACTGVQEKTGAQDEFDIGLSLFNRGLFEEAVTHFKKAAELEPEYGRAYLYLGRSFLNLGRWREAIPPLRTAFRLEPEETKKEIAYIIFDFLLQNSATIDRDTQFEILDYFTLE
jgi:tetratricopeptide (TPR) repeat protein